MTTPANPIVARGLAPAAARAPAGRWRRAWPWLLLVVGAAGLVRERVVISQVEQLNQQLAQGVPLPAARPASAAVTAAAVPDSQAPREVPPQPTGPANEAASSADAAATSAAPAASAAPVPPWLQDGRPLAWRFGEALSLARAGDDDAALARYRSLYDDALLGLPARYNAANLLLRQGLVLREGPSPGQALPLIELAKEGYRQVLREAPDMAAARYNLERAQRLLPEVDEDDLQGAAPENAERAATTMRGVAQGLP